MSSIDTSLKGFESIGIKISEQQFTDLCTLNMQCNSDGKSVPVFNTIILLRILGLLPEEMLTDAKRDVSEYERKFGLRGKV